MPTISFTTSFKKNTGLLFSAKEIRDSYLYGISFNGIAGRKLQFSDEDIEFHVNAAQTEISNYLSVKLQKEIYTETITFSNDDWRTWGFLKTTYQASLGIQLQGLLNTTLQATYPTEWLSVRKESDNIQFRRSIYMVPSGNTGAITNGAMTVGLLPNLGYLNSGMVPNYWKTSYTTGFDKVPADIMQAIGQLATLSLLYIAGANVLGTPGISGSSLSIDGLSQSLTSAINAFGDRIKGYNQDLQRKLPMLIGTYRGINFAAC